MRVALAFALVCVAFVAARPTENDNSVNGLMERLLGALEKRPPPARTFNICIHKNKALFVFVLACLLGNQVVYCPFISPFVC